MSGPRPLYATDPDMRWMVDAACTKVPGLPWTERRSKAPRFVVEQMAEVCATCPVLDRCESFLDEAGITAGYWAGRSRNRFKPGDLPRKARPRRDAA